MYFTKEDLQKIEEYLKLNSLKDSEFDAIDSLELNPEDTVVVVHDNENRKVSLEALCSSVVLLASLDNKLQEYEQYREQLNKDINLLREIINNVQINKIGVVDSFGDSSTYGISQRVLTEKINELEERISNPLSFDITDVSTSGKTVTTKYKNIVVSQGDQVIANYITPIIELSTATYPKVWFIPASGNMSVQEIEDYVSQNDFQQSGRTYQKSVTSTDYYVVLEKGHTLSSVVNSFGFSYSNAFIQESSENYNIYHYSRVLTVQIDLTFNIN